ncbi:TPA: pilus assembly protein [Clostridioides difficile]|uniref:DUF859 family phage minor structural protein n=1 Tax=Clostridioides difficile TaxID=1496 RepID=UPI00103462F4|nr:DUF859 family phage minor structural protein [Clostridioides difficile]EJA5902351.1 pilus assembly protein [Clostridioides difficile]MBY2766689.1 pilus assembly protein [Clostridioides difficile]MDE3481711.1 DUF859 family phage minor structural protein [Clostridioides difficile]MDE3496430.1 DUF859 family phage minor structural protein [Clostridioides difficile]MDE3626007.1 DUF859 family phage minor structural protein [Clostridioides difficile]
MASSGSITTNESHGRSVTLSWSLSSQNIEKNTSTIAWTLKGSGFGGGWVMSGGFKAAINGTTVYSTSTDSRIQLYNGTVVASGSITISHNSDGTKSFGLSCEAGVYTYAVSVTASGTHTLNTIPRASSVTASSASMGESSTITISRASSSFTHTLTFAFGSATGTIATKTSSTSVSWSVPLSLASQIPRAVSGSGTITCDTYSGNTKVGTKSCSVTLSVPASVKPTISSLSVTRVDETVPSSWGVYVQSKSKAKLTINGASGSYGSTISSYSISGGGFSSTSSSFTTGILSSSGTITFAAKVTDSRGRVSDEKKVSITVVAYTAPTFTSYLSQRATSSGAVNDDGTYIRGLISYSFASCSNKNTVTRATYYKKSSSTTWSNANKSFDSGTAFVYGGGSISTESSYDVKYTITDAFTTVTIYDTVSTAKVLMDFKVGGTGVAIGKVAEKDNVVEIADSWELRLHGKNLIDYIYPVGSIYMSVNATSPAKLFGGTWTQLKDRFLIGAGSSYVVNATGGESSHKLTVAEMPKHAHDTPFFNNMTDNGEMKSDFIGVYGKGATASAAMKEMGVSSTMEMWWFNQTNKAEGNEWSYLTSSKGSTSAHNNMPPYLAVYMWKRTA